MPAWLSFSGPVTRRLKVVIPSSGDLKFESWELVDTTGSCRVVRVVPALPVRFPSFRAVTFCTLPNSRFTGRY